MNEEVSLPFANYPSGGRRLLGEPSSGELAPSRHGYGISVSRLCGMTCAYCGRDLHSAYEDWLDTEVDHVIPSTTIKSLGYPKSWVGDFANLVICCSACNAFTNRFPVNEPVPATVDEFLKLRDDVFRRKREHALSRHREERKYYEQHVKGSPDRSQRRAELSEKADL